MTLSGTTSIIYHPYNGGGRGIGWVRRHGTGHLTLKYCGIGAIDHVPVPKKSKPDAPIEPSTAQGGSLTGLVYRHMHTWEVKLNLCANFHLTYPICNRQACPGCFLERL